MVEFLKFGVSVWQDGTALGPVPESGLQTCAEL